MIVYDKPHATIKYYPKYSLLYTEWHGFAKSDEYREVLEVLLQLALDNDVHNWLGNSKKMKAIRQVDQDWTSEIWVPKFLQVEVHKSATILSDDIFNRMAIDSIKKKLEDDEEVHEIESKTRYFDDPQEALEWITGKKGTQFSDLDNE